MGPLQLPMNMAIGIGWAHCSGPLKLARSIAVGLEWAHFTYLQCYHWHWMGPFGFLQKLLLPLNGPISPTYKCCRWPQMSLLELPMNLPLALEWSHCRCLESCPWMCPVQLGRNVAVGKGCEDDLELAHSHAWGKLSMALSWPILIHEEICQWPWIGQPNIGTGKNGWWPWMGPFTFMRKTTDYCKWAH